MPVKVDAYMGLKGPYLKKKFASYPALWLVMPIQGHRIHHSYDYFYI